MRSALTLGRVFSLSILGLILLLGILFYEIYRGSIDSVLHSAQALGEQACEQISLRVSEYMDQANDTLKQFEEEIRYGTTNPKDVHSLESGLFSLLISDEDIAEISFTYGKFKSFSDNGDALLEENGRGQISVYRIYNSQGQEDHIKCRRVFLDKGRYVSEFESFLPHSSSILTSIDPEKSIVDDPTTHLTFQTPLNRENLNRAHWSDIYRAELDSHLPKEKQRKVVSIQKAILDQNGTPLGVLRVGLFEEQIERMVDLKLLKEHQSLPHQVFICDSDGRLITRGNPQDELEELEDAFRINPKSLPKEIQLALKHPHIQHVSESNPLHSGELGVDEQTYLATFRRLNELWIVGVIIPESFYLNPLLEKSRGFVMISLVIVLVIVVGGICIAFVVRRAGTQIISETSRMNRFEFAPSPCHSSLGDVREVLLSLEKAKTAMRAMSKYVPIDLVRQLYLLNSEPTLGSETMEVTLMFTDIKGFTEIAEKLPANQLADAMGKYFKTMANQIQDELGTIDKFIGDAVMAFWNAPNPTPDHAIRACRCAVRCRDELEVLFQSADWIGLPPLYTRFGLNKDFVKVGHFGAPDRLNYTAIGDGVNLASRLEGLNKEFKTNIMVSEAIFESTQNHFEFRFINAVTVRGKTQSVKVYELISEKNLEGDPLKKKL
jgi:adenylate cyclase